MSTTPETDAAVIDGYTFCQEDMRPAIAFCANLERERDAARAEVEAMREAIKEAHEAFDELWNLSFDVPWATSEKAESALAKLQPFIKP